MKIRSIKSTGVLEYWSIGVLGFNTLLHHSTTPVSTTLSLIEPFDKAAFVELRDQA
jgi:hypothetical protein